MRGGQLVSPIDPTEEVPILARILPAFVKRAVRRVLRVRFFGWRRYCPVCGAHARVFLPFGSPRRPDAMCPFCGSLERHRLVWLFFQKRTDLFDGRPKRILHFAPEPSLAPRLAGVPGVDYLSADLESPKAMVHIDVTDIPYPDGSFDVVYCSHVLEHVPDDRRAMREIRRILSPAGWAALQVPITAPVTDEDPSVTDPGERVRRFGQHDHVRRYGPDFATRLQEAGFRVSRVTGDALIPPEEHERLAIRDREVFFCTPA